VRKTKRPRTDFLRDFYILHRCHISISYATLAPNAHTGEAPADVESIRRFPGNLTPSNRNKGSPLMLTTILLLALGIGSFGAFGAYVMFCDRV
jgi:hypothetical protein